MDDSRTTLDSPQSADDSSPADGRTRTTNLSRERIIEGAIALLDAEGLPGLSMRRLADNLDAGAMSLYWYVPTKDALLQMATDAVLGEVSLTDLPDDWRAATRQLAMGVRHTVHRHPWLSAQLTTESHLGPCGLMLIETILSVFAGAGLRERQLDAALTTLYGYVLGLAIGEKVWVSTVQESLQVPDAFRRESGPDHPMLVTFLSGAVAINNDERFIGGLDLILDGIEAMRQA